MTDAQEIHVTINFLGSHLCSVRKVLESGLVDDLGLVELHLNRPQTQEGQ